MELRETFYLQYFLVEPFAEHLWKCFGTLNYLSTLESLCVPLLCPIIISGPSVSLHIPILNHASALHSLGYTQTPRHYLYKVARNGQYNRQYCRSARKSEPETRNKNASRSFSFSRRSISKIRVTKRAFRSRFPLHLLVLVLSRKIHAYSLIKECSLSNVAYTS